MKRRILIAFILACLAGAGIWTWIYLEGTNSAIYVLDRKGRGVSGATVECLAISGGRFEDQTVVTDEIGRARFEKPVREWNSENHITMAVKKDGQTLFDGTIRPPRFGKIVVIPDRLKLGAEGK